MKDGRPPTADRLAALYVADGPRSIVIGQGIKPRLRSYSKLSLFCPSNRQSMDVKIEAGWKELLKNEFTKPYFLQIVNFLKTEKMEGRVIYPPGSFIFNAFNSTPFDKVKVVILGQDPYHGPGQAHGLCFSVPDGVPPPPSLVNIFKELHTDTGTPIPSRGNLTHWAEQGVLLLNASLTVRANEPMSHSKIGWAEFTDTVIRKISEDAKTLFFCSGGNLPRKNRC